MMSTATVKTTARRESDKRTTLKPDDLNRPRRPRGAAGENRCGGERDAVKPSLPTPRLLDVHATAAYLSVSAWTIRDWVAAGRLQAVELPALRAREGDRQKARLRRLLFDRAALDQFVSALRGAVDTKT